MSLLGSSEFADLVDLTPGEVRALIASGTLPANEVAGRYVIDLGEVEQDAPAIFARISDVDHDDDEDEDEEDKEDEEDDDYEDENEENEEDEEDEEDDDYEDE